MESNSGLSEFFTRTASLPLLTASQERELGRRAQNSDPAAIEKLILHNVRLAISIAKKWQNRGVPLEDLVQEAMLGLDRAARKFDPNRGLKFSTYATWWVNHFLQRVVHNTGATIRVPSHITVRRLAAEEYLSEHPKADDREIAAAVECEPSEVKEALASTRVVASLDVDNEESHSVYDKLADPQAVDPEGSLFTDSRVRDAMMALKPQEVRDREVSPESVRRIVELRYGVDGPERKFTEIGKEFGLTSAEAQKVLAHANEELRKELKGMKPECRESEAHSLPAEESEVICSRTEEKCT